MSFTDRLAHHLASALRSYLPCCIQAMKLDALLIADCFDFVFDVEEIAWHRRTRVFRAEPFMLRLLKEGRPAPSGGWNTSPSYSPWWCGFAGPRVERMGTAIVPRIGGRIVVRQGRRPLREPTVGLAVV